MIRRILVPCDGSSAAEHAVRSGIELARATRATVVGLAITEPFPLKMYGELMVAGVGPLQHYNDQERALAEHALAPVEKAARAAGVDYLSASVSNSSAADAIISAAEQESCDLICLAAHDRRNLLGTHLDHDTLWVLAHARVPVLLCH